MTLRAPPSVRDAMKRVQLNISSPQDEVLLARWLDFARATALARSSNAAAQKMDGTSKDDLQECLESPMVKRPKSSAPESQPSTSN